MLLLPENRIALGQRKQVPISFGLLFKLPLLSLARSRHALVAVLQLALKFFNHSFRRDKTHTQIPARNKGINQDDLPGLEHRETWGTRAEATYRSRPAPL